MLQFLFSKPEQRPQPDLVAIGILLRLFHRLRNDELLNVGEDVAVGVTGNLIQFPPLIRIEALDPIDASNAVRKKTF